MTNAKRLLLDTTCGLALGLFVLFWVGWLAIDFGQPLRLHDDYVLILFNVKSLLHFGTIYHNPAVAFPDLSDYSAFPTPDIAQYALIRFLGLFTDNPVTTLSLFDAICFVATTLSAFLAMRATRVGMLLAACGAVVFAASAFMCVRAPLHSYFCFAVIIPWVCRFCLLLAYQAPRLAMPAFTLTTTHALLLGIAAASCGLYYAFFSALFIGVAALLLLLMRRSFATLKPALIALAALVATFTFWLLPNFWTMLESGMRLPKRDYFEQILYGLRFPDLLIPQLPPFLSTYGQYAARQEGISSEGNYAILGLWGIVGLVAGLALCLGDLLRSSRRNPPLFAPMRRRFMAKFALVLTAAGIAFAMPYGLGFIFNMLVSGTIRAQTRIAIFLLFFAIFITVFLLDKARQSWRGKAGAFFFVATTLMLLTATIAPNFQTIAHGQQANAAEWASKRQSYTGVLQQLDSQHLIAVAQYPSYYYPEGPQYVGFGNTDHFWPYLLDGSTERRWSFGSMAQQPLWRLLAEISQWPSEEFFIALRCLNYDALLIEKRALAPQAAIAFKAHLQTLDQDRILWDDAQRVLVAIGKTPVSLPVCEKVSAARAALAAAAANEK